MLVKFKIMEGKGHLKVNDTFLKTYLVIFSNGPLTLLLLLCFSQMPVSSNKSIPCDKL